MAGFARRDRGPFLGHRGHDRVRVDCPRAAHAITDPWSDPTVYASAIRAGRRRELAWLQPRSSADTAPDAQTCADLGAAYDNTQATGGGALASPTPMASMTADQADTYIACKMANTQVVSYCQAYKLNKKAEDSQVILLPLDVAAAAICWAACSGQVLPGAGQALVTACEIAGAAAGTMQFVELARLNTLFGEVTNGRTLEMIAAGLGMASAAGGAALQGAAAGTRGAAKPFEPAGVEASRPKDVDGLREKADLYDSQAAEGGPTSDQQSTCPIPWTEKQTKDAARKMACMTAATFTALSAVRGISWGIIASNKRQGLQRCGEFNERRSGTTYDPRRAQA